MNTTDRNNFQRVVAAARVVYMYMQASRTHRPCLSRSTEQAMIDLVTDLRHMAEVTEVDFNAVLSASLDIFEEDMW